LTNYAPDYIGQLIRGGKIRGEQVYSNVAWVTTEDEVRAYMADKSRTVKFAEGIEKVEALGERAFSYALYAVIALLFLALLVMQYILYVSLDDSLEQRLVTTESVEEQT